jgi:hypothetical protein
MDTHILSLWSQEGALVQSSTLPLVSEFQENMVQLLVFRWCQQRPPECEGISQVLVRKDAKSAPVMSHIGLGAENRARERRLANLFAQR